MSDLNNLENAIATVLSYNEPLTIHITLAAYIISRGDTYVPGRGVPHHILAAFEHALDKYPAPSTKSTPQSSRRPYTAEIAKLRKDYWTAKFEHSESRALHCTCKGCGQKLGCTRAELEEKIGEPSQRRSAIRRRELDILLIGFQMDGG